MNRYWSIEAGFWLFVLVTLLVAAAFGTFVAFLKSEDPVYGGFNWWWAVATAVLLSAACFAGGFLAVMQP